MKKKFKIMLACEEESGKGVLSPLVQGSIDITYNPEANNSQAVKELAIEITGKLRQVSEVEVLNVVNKLMLGQK